MTVQERLMRRFQGQQRAHGCYDMTKIIVGEDGYKRLGKAQTVVETVTTGLWEQHITGKRGLGIIPIRDDSTCYFGAIDIDIYKEFDAPKFIADLYNKKIPLIPCRSKSGGLHLYLFLQEPLSAGDIMDKLKMWAAYIGHSNAEIFPKQRRVLADRNDFGNWINMPYFDIEVTDRYAYGPGFEALKIEQFLDLADKTAISVAEFEKIQVGLVDDLSDGPPCLQAILSTGVRSGNRNNVMFNVAVYLHKVFGDGMAEAFDRFNLKYMQPVLSSVEIQNLRRSVDKKDYCYSCSREPLKSHCNMPICRQRRHGIGGLTGMPHFSGLTKYCTNPPIWFLNLPNGERMEVSTSDLHRQDMFQKRCIERLNTYPPTIKSELWHAIIQRLLENVVEVEAPRDSSPEGILYEHLEKFCTTKVQAKREEELLFGKPYHDKAIHCHVFRLSDFMAYLTREKFMTLKEQRISVLLKDIRGEHVKRRIVGKVTNLWQIPEYPDPVKGYEIPEIKGNAVM